MPSNHERYTKIVQYIMLDTFKYRAHHVLIFVSRASIVKEDVYSFYPPWYFVRTFKIVQKIRKCMICIFGTDQFAEKINMALFVPMINNSEVVIAQLL